MTRKTETCWVAGLLLAALLLRWLPALYPHFWFDEIYTIAMTRKSFGEILRIGAADMHPPLYYDWVKALAAVGAWLGGPFATLCWLRMASILPGMAACFIGWRLARRCWGRGPALWTLGAFALAPALTYYSVELRCYSTLHALLLGAMWGFLQATDPEAKTRGPGWTLFGACALAAFYTHGLSILYLGGFGLIFLAEMELSQRRGELARRGAILAAVLAAGCAPWIPFMFPQTAALNAEKWLGWADWRNLRATFLWYMPLGPLRQQVLENPWPWMGMTVIALAMALLILNAWRNRASSRPSANPLPWLNKDRLLIYSALLAIIPVLVGFFLSYYRIAKVFLGFRYNLIPAPFITLAMVGLLLRLDGPRRRAAAFATLFAVWSVCDGFLFRQRISECDIIGQAAQVKPEILRPNSRLVWNNPTVLPWLGKCGKARHIGSIDEVLAERPGLNRQETIYLLTHQALDVNYCGLLDPQSYLLKEILKRRGIPKERIPSGAWDGVWRLTPADLPPLASELKNARERIEARRRVIAGGQVLLPDAEIFNSTRGWGPLEFGPDLLPERWTESAHTHLVWDGPHRPGAYRLKCVFRRPYPFPEKTMNVRYRLPGRNAWSSHPFGTGRVVIEDRIHVSKPRQHLCIELITPTWMPSEYQENTLDDRRLGMIFEALELYPENLTLAAKR